MKKSNFRIILATAVFCLFSLSFGNNFYTYKHISKQTDDSTKNDTSKLKYPFKDKKPWDYKYKKSRFDLKDPEVIKKNTEYDAQTNTYTEYQKLGNKDLNYPRSKSFSEYLKEIKENEEKNYFKTKSKATNTTRNSGIIPQIITIPPIVDKLFGGGLIDIKPSGSAEATFGGNYNV